MNASIDIINPAMSKKLPTVDSNCSVSTQTAWHSRNVERDMNGHRTSLGVSLLKKLVPQTRWRMTKSSRDRHERPFKLFAVFASGCFFLGSYLSAQTGSVGHFVEVTVHAKCLESNLLEESPDRTVEVYLPPSYGSEPNRRFPVLYHLHGYSLHSVLRDWTDVFTDALNMFVAKNPSSQMIVVIPDGWTRVGGSFWLNSTVGGRWEEFVSSELPRYVDAHFRTIPDRSARAVSGHSMGGFAALRMGELHRDTFSVVYAFSPCCMDFIADMTSSNPAWHDVLKFRDVSDIHHAITKDHFWQAALAAFAIAASPAPNVPLRANLPYSVENGMLTPVSTVVRRWQASMPDNLVRDHVADLRSLAGLALDYGLEDEFSHIPIGANKFTQELEEHRIPFFFESYHGSHNDGVPSRVSTRLLPFLAEKLAFQSGK